MTESPDLVADVTRRLDLVRARIEAAGGDPSLVTVLAVTKGHGLPAVRAALHHGLCDLGESYAQELVAKADELADADADAVRWHVIGGLQRKNVRRLAPHAYLWQSVDRLALAVEIAQRAPGGAVLVQVNVSGEERQGGCPPARVASMVEGCRDLGLTVHGLMAIGARGDDATVRASFRIVRDLADQLELPERSMGMSDDLALAVAEGSTMVRVGTALFGPRIGAGHVGQ